MRREAGEIRREWSGGRLTIYFYSSLERSYTLHATAVLAATQPGVLDDQSGGAIQKNVTCVSTSHVPIKIMIAVHKIIRTTGRTLPAHPACNANIITGIRQWRWTVGHDYFMCIFNDIGRWITHITSQSAHVCSISKHKIRVNTHKSRSFPVTSLMRVTGAGPIPSTVALSSATPVNPLCPFH